MCSVRSRILSLSLWTLPTVNGVCVCVCMRVFLCACVCACAHALQVLFAPLNNSDEVEMS